MAWYCVEYVQYHGRKMKVMFRYDSLMSMRVAKGKPLEFSKSDEKKVKRLLRRQGKASGPQCDHGCGGPQE
ncbi:MAG: hypothetical protein G01um101429_688 [Parcubacteria group bacterium Gr01-1014_29]|nr:MAG: hypothetical protein G01um101429_688 [Parcubacteria group bacterium Gr01-1014_29]